MNIALIGTGYVGLTTGVALAFMGHETTCLDVDADRIRDLEDGIMPFYEPHLEDMFRLVRSRLHFHTGYDAIASANVVFITVGTPPGEDGAPDLRYVRSAAEAIGKNLKNNYTVVVNKSTVPIGSGNWVESLIRESYESVHGMKPNGRFSVASNPEFLREGAALQDTLYPDRVVIGASDSRAIEVLHALYRPILEQAFNPPAFLPRPETMGAAPLIATGLQSAELVKYAANAFLSLKVSYINEIAQLAERVGADISEIAKGIGLDRRIGTQFLQAGVGWGGSCFGKDTSALISTGGEYGVEMSIVCASRRVNYRQRELVVEKLLHNLKILKGRTIGLLGLAFKPNTDDLRDSPALDIAKRLAQRGANVRAHDPIAMPRAKEDPAWANVTLCESVESMASGSDGLVLVTDWPHYRKLDWPAIGVEMRNRLVVDGRNYLDPCSVRTAGFEYVGFGR